MGPIWGQQGPGGPHVGPMNFAIWEYINTQNPPREISSYEISVAILNCIIWNKSLTNVDDKETFRKIYLAL